MLKEWLTKRVTASEAEACHAVQLDQLGSAPVPFGFLNGAWRSLLAKVQPGDEIWEFSSPGENWINLAGQRGYALVRGGEVVERIVTVRS